jgi:hypothetical protein
MNLTAKHLSDILKLYDWLSLNPHIDDAFGKRERLIRIVLSSNYTPTDRLFLNKIRELYINRKDEDR